MKPLLKTTAIGLLICTLSACVSAPKPLQGDYMAISPLQSKEIGAMNQRVRWGGKIVKTTPYAERTCFEIVAMPLSDSARPKKSDRSLGRFFACRKGFYDPMIFTEGREITISGTLSGFDSGQVGDYRYEYPVVDAAVIYLWSDKVEHRIIYHDPYWPIWW